MSGVDHPGSPRRRRWRIVALVTLLLAVVTLPVTLAALAFWAADGSWEFAGGGFRHWVFIKGSTVDRLGFVAATGEPARYVVRLGEGTDPGAIFAVYDSGAMPGDVVGAYAERCRDLEHASADHRWSWPHAGVQLLTQPDNVSENVCAKGLKALPP